MRTRFDQLGKGVFGSVGELLGQVRMQYEIPGQAQAADLVFWPDGERMLERAGFGLIGRMLAAPCMIECFHEAPGEGEVRDCLGRLNNLHRHLRRRAGEIEAQGLASLSGEDAVHLWIVSAGRPETVLRGLACRPMDAAWGAGFWQAPELLCTSVVVVRDLPESRETLLLRLVGAGKTLARALRELRELPRDAWEVELVAPLVLAFRIEAAQNPGEDTMQYMDELNAVYKKWRQEAEEEGRVEGRVESLRHSLLVAYRTRFGQPPPSLTSALQAAGAGTLDRWLPLFVAGTREDIIRAVQGDD